MRRFLIFAFIAALSLPAIPALAQPSSAIEIVQPWARATPGGAQTGAIYLTIKNSGDTSDQLLREVSPVAQKAQVHQTSLSNGVMKMRELAQGIQAPAKTSVVFKPGSYHIMLIGLKKPLKAGQSIPLTLTFKKAGDVVVTVPVEAIGAMAPQNIRSGSPNPTSMEAR